jgi:ATP-dependent protease ClpP protease subunit
MYRPPSNLADLRAAWRMATGTAAHDRPCYRIADVSRETSAAVSRETRAAVYVFGAIGGWDMDAEDFVRDVGALDVDAIDLMINSPGGFVFDAVAMHEALRTHAARVDVHITGLAASAASFLAMVGDSVEISKGGRVMIHDAQGIGIGSPADMREYADFLDAVSDDMAGFYAARAGGKPAQWRERMTATTWYSAQQAVDAKLADRIAGDQPDDHHRPGPDNRSRIILARHRALTALGG